MNKRDFIKATVAGIIGFFTPKAFASERQYTQEEKELIMAAALDKPEGKEALNKAMNFGEHYHQMLVDVAGSGEDLDKVFKELVQDPEFFKRLGKELEFEYRFADCFPKLNYSQESIDKFLETKHGVKERYEKDVKSVAHVLEQRKRHPHPKFQRMNELLAYLGQKPIF